MTMATGPTLCPFPEKTSAGREKLNWTICLIFVTIAIWRVSKNRKLRRIIFIWQRALPQWLTWSCLKLQSRTWCWDADKWNQEAQKYYDHTAPMLFDTVSELGGYFIKLGQRFSMSRGIISETYVDALKPLCVDVPSRPFETMAEVFLSSTGKSLDDLFEFVDHDSLGSASLAQVHRAVVCKDQGGTREVVVKIMYPEVDETFVLDLDNVLLLCKFLAPEIYEHLNREYETHMNELDFRSEARSLTRITQSMIHAGFAPHEVVIPQPLMPSTCTTRKTLVMDFLPGLSFQSIIARDVDAFARALGLRDAQELREQFNATSGAKEIGRSSMDKRGQELGDCAAPKHINWNDISRAKRVSEMSSQIKNWSVAVHNGFILTARGIGARAFLSESFLQMRQYQRSQAEELQRILDVVVQVHGHQMLLDGFVNIDPHPGNILIAPDGRVGLIDYGQCVEFSIEERRGLCRVIRALGSGDKLGAVAAMRALPGGYKIQNDCWQAVFKWAEGTFDKVDFTPLPYDDGGFTPTTFDGVHERHMEIVVPRCVTFARRLTHVLMGMGMSFGVQVSLASSWRAFVAEVDKAVVSKEFSETSNVDVGCFGRLSGCVVQGPPRCC